jgi:vomeronasal1 receptor
MVSLLFRHHSRAQHIHSLSFSAQTSPEHKATHSILLLVGFFVFFYFSNNFITFYLFYRPEKNIVLEKITGILSSCYPSICSFVLISNRKIISKFISSFSEIEFLFSQRIFND